MHFTVTGLHKGFAGQPVLSDIHFDVRSGEIVSLIGPSGVGKTTLLTILAGLEKADRGRVIFERPPSREHPVILVFQDYTLFPNMSVFENVAFGLRVRRLPATEVEQRVMPLLEWFQLADKRQAHPRELSAGQKQRVAIARAMVVNPAVLLLDEPFANLDRNLKLDTARFIRDTHKRFGVTTVSVTHDLEEAFVMSDRIGIILDGRLVQYDRAETVYHHPATLEAARFLGPMNDLGPATLAAMQHSETDRLFVRPEALLLEKNPDGPGRVVEIAFAGHYTKYTVRLAGQDVLVHGIHDSISPGDAVGVRLAPHFIPNGDLS